ncbi:DUF7146 domain-containing protein [Diaphorobacter sp.]|uniref:DUF7146 domain-containing protein n=1 Tax=Diaphorobacter sp. TaxID=1934310 RepID=UPI003D0E8F89
MTTAARTATTDPRHAYEVNRARIAAVWAQARLIVAGDAADMFLRRSGALPPGGKGAAWPNALRMHPALDYWRPQQGGPGECIGRFPALLAALELDTHPHGLTAPPVPHTVALQRIYLTPDGALAHVPAPIKLTGKDGPSRCAALRLVPVAQRGATLGIAVGVVPALRMGHACRIPVWAVPDAAALAHVRWPRRTACLYVFVNADDPAQHAPAAQLARKATACGLEVFTLMTCAVEAPAEPLPMPRSL